jgi:hypothetical protein
MTVKNALAMCMFYNHMTVKNALVMCMSYNHMTVKNALAMCMSYNHMTVKNALAMCMSYNHMTVKNALAMCMSYVTVYAICGFVCRIAQFPVYVFLKVCNHRVACTGQANMTNCMKLQQRCCLLSLLHALPQNL